MTNSTRPALKNRFVLARLPWLIAAVAFIIYGVTLNHWVSLSNLPLVARSAGWIWGAELYNPLFYLVTYPFRWLPNSAVPVGFNLFSMMCAVLSLALLSRSIALLPRDRTQDQRLREKTKHSVLSLPTSWIPPVLAAAACGLQLTFWESATSGASDMFDVLLLAYIIRNLLEFRVSRRDSWIYRATLVCGAAMANSWLLFLFFPAFLIAVIWIKGLEFFNARFFLRMLLCGLGGLLLYLLLPVIHVMTPEHTFSFWQALKTNLAMDKQAFLHFVKGAPVYKRLLLAFTALVPLLVMGVRWASNFGDPSKMGSTLATLIFHLAHSALLGFGLWIAFDPVFSPRQIGYSIPGLYYLNALSIGYFSGYFLLVFTPLPDRMGRTAPWVNVLNRVAFVLIVILLVVVPVGLLGRNVPQVRMTNGPAVKNYCTELVQQLPPKAVLLSDDSRKLLLAQAVLTQAGKSTNYFFLDSQLLTYAGYHVFQQKLHPDAWPMLVEPQRTNEIGGRLLIQLMIKLSETNALPLCYLHPSFGYYFEVYDQRPRGLSVDLKLYPTNSLSGPPFSETEIASNEKFWNQHQTTFDQLKPFIAATVTTNNISFPQRVLNALHIPFEPNNTAVAIGGYYSQALDFWGVQLERLGKLDPAREHFQTALALFPSNLAARDNLALNRDLKAGNAINMRMPKSLEEELGVYRGWDQVLRDTGPFDDPTHCFGIALTFAQGNLYRQAAQQLQRTHALVPENVPTTFWLARLYIMNRMADESLKLLASLNDRMEDLSATGIRTSDFVQTKATALFADNKPVEANQLLETMIQKNLKNPQVLTAVMQVSAAFRSYTNALRAVDQLLVLKPDDIPALFSQGVFLTQTKDFTNAIFPLTRVLNLQTNYYNAQLFRAVAYAGLENLTAAQKDYERLAKIFPQSNEVNSGLAEIAWRQKDTNAAIRYYTLCLKNTPVDSPQATYFSDRINSLQSPAPH